MALIGVIFVARNKSLLFTLAIFQVAALPEICYYKVFNATLEICSCCYIARHVVITVIMLETDDVKT